MMWYNQITRELQSNPPWYPSSFVDDSIKEIYFQNGWGEVEDTFTPPIQEELPE